MNKIEFIVTGLAKGKTLKEISKELNMGYSTLRKFVKENNIVYTKTTKRKYSDEDIIASMKSSSTMKEVFDKLGIPCAGGSFQWIHSRLNKMGINKTDLLKPRIYKGCKKKEPDEILIVRKEGSQRETAHRLRKALIESGIDYNCDDCGIFEWNDKKLTLNVHHINENRLDNRIENLCFMCPNCHSTKHRRSTN